MMSYSHSLRNNCPTCTKPFVRKKDPLRFLFSNTPPTDLIPVGEMEVLVSKNRRTLMNWAKQGRFPLPLVQKNRILGWRRDRYEAWLKSEPPL